MVVRILNVVGIINGGCAAAVSNNIVVVLGNFLKVCVAFSLVLGIVWVLELANGVVFTFFRSGRSICRVAL